MILTTTLPIHTVSALNTREHYRARARRVARERQDAGYLLAAAWRSQLPPSFEVVRVHFERVGKRLLDSDNLPGSCKAIRDEVAQLLKVSDGPETGIDWTYSQKRGIEPAVVVRLHLAVGLPSAEPLAGPLDDS